VADFCDVDSEKISPLNKLPFGGEVCVMDLSNSKDERLLSFYDSVRREVELDIRSGGRYRFAGDGVKQYADNLREELERRRLRFTPIEWPR
jgi:hypothetical protein